MTDSVASIRVANAPCSWGVLEFEGLEGEEVAYGQMLDELHQTGYTGTELGDWGYMPTEADALRAELERRALALVGAFVPVALADPVAHSDGEARALRTARLIAGAARSAAQGDQAPFLILADDNGSDALRTRYAGRVTPELGLSEARWETFARGAERIARAVLEQTGLKTAFHHHCAGYIETPQEIAHFLEKTDPGLVGLVFDTGHYLFGSGGVEGAIVLDGFRRFRERIWHVHFKDCDPYVAEQARAEEWDYFKAIGHGVFCELGKGAVPFATLVKELRATGYRGWVVVEQDVLPGMGSPRASAQRNRDFLRTVGL